MKQSEHEINNVIKSALQKSSPSVSFEALWDLYSNKGRTKLKYRKATLVPLIVLFTLLSCFTIGYASLSQMTDDIDLPFVDDPAVIGKWESIDFVNDINGFNPQKRYTKVELYLNTLVFIKDGKMLDRIDNANLVFTDNTWTKGVVINKNDKTASKYEIKEIEGSKYMFFQWKNGDYIRRFVKPHYYVLKQIDSEDYSNYDTPRIEDTINYTFTNNTEMLGSWKSIDRIDNIDDFNPNELRNADALILKTINIKTDGKLTMQLAKDQTTITVSNQIWTGDLIINPDAATVSKCTIKTLEGSTYMFFEWKSGDYSYRGMKPIYYVLKKVE